MGALAGETATDRRNMLTALGAETMLYSPSATGGFAFEVTALFIETGKADDLGDIEFEGTGYEINVVSADVPDLRDEDTFMRSDNSLWTVKKVTHDQGIEVLQVQKT